MFTKQKASVERALNQLMDIYNDKKDFIGLGFRGLGFRVQPRTLSSHVSSWEEHERISGMDSSSRLLP